MTDQTPDAAREAREWREVLAQRFRETGLIEFPSHATYGRARMKMEDSVADDLRTLDTYAAAVSRARDAAWRSAVEAVRAEHGPGGTKSQHAPTALDTLLARMDTAKIKQEPTDV